MDLGMNFDWTIVFFFLGIIFFSIILVLIIVSKFGVASGRGGNAEKPLPARGNKGDRGGFPDPLPPPPNPPQDLEPDPEPEKGPVVEAKTFCVVVEETHSELGKFKKIFSERLAQWTGMKPVRENEKNRAYMIIGFKVHRHILRNPLDNYVLISYKGWLTQTQEAFCDGDESFREIKYGGDEEKLFEGAAFKIASTLTKNYPDLFV